MGFHIVKRDRCPLWERCCYYAGAVLIALLLGAIILLVIGVNPISYYSTMFTIGVFESIMPHQNVIDYLVEFVPLVLTSVALSLAFKMRFWNIGGEGQFIMGAIAAAFVAIQYGSTLPDAVTLVLMCLAAMLAAGAYGLIAALLKVKFGTNETLMTLMLNYIAIYFLSFLSNQKGAWNIWVDPNSPRTTFLSFSNEVGFPTIPLIGKFELNTTVIFTLLIGALVFVYLKYTKQGYEINVVGDSASTARYAGMKVNWIVIRTVLLSACLIGIAAAFKIGTSGQLSESITNNVGWTGIVVAWLAQLNTVAIFIVSALIGVLQFGSTQAAASFGQVDSSFANMLQGAILFFVLAADFCIRFRIARTKKGGGK